MVTLYLSAKRRDKEFCGLCGSNLSLEPAFEKLVEQSVPILNIMDPTKSGHDSWFFYNGKGTHCLNTAKFDFP